MIETGPAAPGAAIALSAIHAEAFATPWEASWSTEEIALLMKGPGVFALEAWLAGEPAGFILCRIAADEAEVLTLAVRPAARRQGVASALVSAAKATALASGAVQVFLEVATDNPAAAALYRAHGFRQVGERPGYYKRQEGAVGAMIMRHDLNR